MKSVASHSRRGFTLIELLMVITIIGMLMGLLIVGVNRALVRARQAEITMQIDSLDQAMQNAKAEYGLYPPDCSNLSGSASGAGDTYRQARILAFFRKAFPKLIVPAGYGTSASPAVGSLQYLSQYAWGNASQIPTPSGYNLGDLDNLDPAEAIVFFLGGPPAAVGVPITTGGGTTYGYSLAGWSANISNPFSNSGQRGTSLYEFQSQRLGDADGDGWPEYYPPNGDIPQPPGTSATAAANPAPPYVYFDATTYEYFFTFSAGTAPTAASAYPTGYPYADHQLSAAMQTQMNALQAQWGVALPYVNSQAVNPAYGAGVNDYINPKKFQIIAAGVDTLYAVPPAGALLSAPQPFRFFSSGINYTQGDLDNVTNFTTGKLQDATP